VPGRQVQAAPALAYLHIPEYSLLNKLNFTGIKQGEISPTSVNSEFLTTLAEMEDMKATLLAMIMSMISMEMFMVKIWLSMKAPLKILEFAALHHCIRYNELFLQMVIFSCFGDDVEPR
jgi:hypothetical protein